MEAIAINTKTTLITGECCNCGVIFAMPEALRRQLKKTGGTFYCPAGHSQYYTDSTEKQLKEARQALAVQAKRNSNLSGQLDGALKQISVKKGQITKLKNRVKAGVCTECHRHFENLQRHMESKHKEK